MTVYVEGKVNEQASDPGEGMVMDFDVIKQVWEIYLKPILDHKDLNEQFLFVTTAENLAAWILVTFHDNGVPARTLDLWETETCCASVQYQDVWGAEATYRAMTVMAAKAEA